MARSSGIGQPAPVGPVFVVCKKRRSVRRNSIALSQHFAVVPLPSDTDVRREENLTILILEGMALAGA